MTQDCRTLNLSIWALAWAVGLAVIYGLDANEYNMTNTEPSFAARVIFNTFHRLGWGLAMSWLIFACFHGYGGDKLSTSTLTLKTVIISFGKIYFAFPIFMPLITVSPLFVQHKGFINTFLSWECFRPLGRMSFNAYLVHYQIIPLIYGQVTYDVVGTHIFIVIMFLSIFVASNLVAAVLSVGIEIPLASCEKLLFSHLLRGGGGGGGAGKRQTQKKEVEAK